MAEQKSVFRKVSLERLSSPEQLDQKLTVVSPIGWTAVVALTILIVAALSWGFFGIISNKVNGNGVLMYSGGIVKVISQTSGRVTEVNVQAGDYIEKGDIIARVDQEELLKQIDQTKKDISALEAINVETLDLDVDSLNNDIYNQFASLAEQIRSARVQYNAQKLEAEKNEQDIAGRKAVQQQQIRTLEQQIVTLEVQIEQYQELLNYQRTIDVENAQVQDERQYVQQDQTDLVLKQLEEDLERANVKLEESQLLFEVGGISRSELETYSREVDRIEREIETRLFETIVENPSTSEQLQNRPDFDSSLASMQSQLENLRLQLTQAQTENSQLNSTFTDYLWGAYNQTGSQMSFLMERFANQKQVLRQDYLKRLEDLQKEYAEKSVIISEFTGTISGFTIQPYDFVQQGSVLGNIVRGGLEAGSSNVILYAPLDRGKLIEPGMEVNISPATVNREEHGYIIGKIVSVSPSSVTQEHMLSVLQDQLLVQAFSGNSAVIEVEVELIHSDDTVSGYQWSTPKGAPFTISPGTICMGEIKVYDQRPIDMVVPFIKKLFR